MLSAAYPALCRDIMREFLGSGSQPPTSAITSNKADGEFALPTHQCKVDTFQEGFCHGPKRICGRCRID